MTFINQNRLPLVYNQIAIRDRGDMLNLTDMWKAAGAVPHNKPSDWLRDAGTKAFVEYLADREKVLVEHLFHITRGRSGETWAHWHIGMAYAKRLSPAFHIWCNEIVRAHMEGIQRAGDLAAILVHVDSRLAEFFAAQPFRVRHGKTAKELWNQFGLPDGIKGATTWFGNRLAEANCSIEYMARYDLNGSGIRLFDPDQSIVCMKVGLLATAQHYVKERLGQGRLSV